MRATRTAAVLAGVMMTAMVGGLHAQGQMPRVFASASDVQAMIAKAKAERKADQANYSQPIVVEAPYSANLEYRVAGLNAPATIHDKDAELFYVVQGSGSLVTGGTLKDGRRTNPENSAGTGIEGGSARRVSAGDVILVPEGTPHWFTQIDGALVLMSVHLPK
jgi:mannose-6-phosphate isomerase-like protein (cupin superfamily)